MFKKLTRTLSVTAVAGALIASGLAAAAPAQAAAVTAAAPAASVPAAKDHAAALPDLLTTSPRPTAASWRPLTITGTVTAVDRYKDRAVVVGSKGCVALSFGLKGQYGPNATGRYTLTTDIMRGRTKVGTAKFTNTNQGRATICPNKSNQRFGYPWHLGWVKVSAQQYVPATHSYRWVNYTAKVTSKTFAVKAKLGGKIHGVSKGSKKSFTTKTWYFSDKHQKNVAYNPSGAKLQYKSGKSWKNYRSLKFSKGKSYTTFYRSGSLQWRVYIPRKNWVVGGTTHTIVI